MTFSSRRPQKGQLVELIDYIGRLSESRKGPYRGKITEIRSKMINCRPANVYQVLLDNGTEVEAKYSMINRNK